MPPSPKGKDELPKTMTQKEARRLLEENGWYNAGGGKHVVKMTKPGRRPVTLPAHKGEKYGMGLTRSILKQAGLIADGS